MTDNNVVRPGQDQTETDVQNESPAERIKSYLQDKLDRDFVIADDHHPLVKTAGTAEALQSNTPVEVQEILSEDLYQDPNVFFREWKQNHIAAVVREAKRRLRNKFGEDVLYHHIEHDHPDNDETRTIELPKNNRQIIEEARDIGYQPTIEFTVNHDEQKLITRDNGIGMTTNEVINVWNEPAVSGSGADLSSAGNKGIGSLTWPGIASKEGALKGMTRTKRQTHGGEDVPARDRMGFAFYSYFGGILPIPDDVPDGFTGTKFEMPIQESVNSHSFKSSMEDYCEVLPVKVTWVEIEDGVTDEDEFEATSFKGRYDSEPSIFIERPGEFAVALDTPDIVSKEYDTDDTFLLDNPIDRNTPVHIDTLWNEHVQLQNEQGLIVAGPNRGKLRAEVDELAGSTQDIKDADRPMPDVPLPEPVASRDNLTRDEANRRFFEYIDHIAQQRELERVAEYINAILDADTIEDALQYVRDEGTKWSLFVKLVKQHGSYDTLDSYKNIAQFLSNNDVFEFSGDDLPMVDAEDEFSNGKTNHNFRDEPRKDWWAHDKRRHIEFIEQLARKVSATTKSRKGDPNNKENRRNDVQLGTLLADEQQWPIYVGATLNQDRCEVLWNDDNEPDAVVLKTNAYHKWTTPPWDAGLVKNVPMSKDEADDIDDYDWHVPDEIDTKKRIGSTTGSAHDKIDLSDPDNFRERGVDVRHKENSTIDFTATIGAIMEALDDTPPDEKPVISDARDNEHTLNSRNIIVFPSNGANVSEHYDMIGHATLIKCNVTESEALLEYKQVYTIEEYKQACANLRFAVYDPYNGHGFTRSIADINDNLGHHIFLHPSPDGNRTLVEDVIYGNDLGNIVVTDNDLYQECRTAGWKYVVNHRTHNDTTVEATPDQSDAWNDDDRIQVVKLDLDSFRKASMVSAYLTHFADQDEWPSSSTAAHVLAPYNDHPYIDQIDNLSTRTAYKLEKRIKRAKYPQWDYNSNAWNYKSKSSSGFNSVKPWTQDVLLALRDAGIDPYEDPDLRRTLGHLIDRCPEDDQ